MVRSISLCRTTGALLLFASLCGCQVWQTSALTDVWGTSADEREIVEQAENDPFPSPADVGLSHDAS